MHAEPDRKRPAEAEAEQPPGGAATCQGPLPAMVLEGIRLFNARPFLSNTRRWRRPGWPSRARCETCTEASCRSAWGSITWSASTFAARATC